MSSVDIGLHHFVQSVHPERCVVVPVITTKLVRTFKKNTVRHADSKKCILRCVRDTWVADGTHQTPCSHQ